jgi:uncharacterized protein YjiS (DUF1127 family)
VRVEQMSMCMNFDRAPAEAWAGIKPAFAPSRYWSLSALVTKFKKSFQACLEHRRAKAELMALDRGTLKDIGLDRSEVESVLTDYAHERRNGVRLLASPVSVPRN